VREDRGVSPGFLFATLLWHEVLATWKTARARGGKPIPALFEAMDAVLGEQAKKIAIPRRFEATIKEIWSLQPRFEQRAGGRPFRLLEHPGFRAGWDFLDLRCQSGELEGDLAGLADWWDRFANAGTDEREAMLKPDAGPKPRSRGRGRGRKRRADGETAQPDGNPPAGEA
jgi:poly(A) polymerase